MNTRTINTFAVSGTAIIAGTIDSGIYSTTNNGSSWFKKNQGFNVIPTISYFINFKQLYLCGNPFIIASFAVRFQKSSAYKISALRYHHHFHCVKTIRTRLIRLRKIKFSMC